VVHQPAEVGQQAFYEPSDWAWAWIVAESISRDLKPQVVGIVEETGEVVRAIIPMKGASLAAYLKAMTALLATEGDRRRANMELERAGAGAASPTSRARPETWMTTAPVSPADRLSTLRLAFPISRSATRPSTGSKDAGRASASEG